MKNKEVVYLTFPTDYETSWLLKEIAKTQGKTQPQLIEEICKQYVAHKIKQAEQYIQAQNK